MSIPSGVEKNGILLRKALSVDQGLQTFRIQKRQEKEPTKMKECALNVGTILKANESSEPTTLSKTNIMDLDLFEVMFCLLTMVNH